MPSQPRRGLMVVGVAMMQSTPKLRCSPSSKPRSLTPTRGPVKRPSSGIFSLKHLKNMACLLRRIGCKCVRPRFDRITSRPSQRPSGIVQHADSCHAPRIGNGWVALLSDLMEGSNVLAMGSGSLILGEDGSASRSAAEPGTQSFGPDPRTKDGGARRTKSSAFDNSYAFAFHGDASQAGLIAPATTK